jgi:hypothetical protein
MKRVVCLVASFAVVGCGDPVVSGQPGTATSAAESATPSDSSGEGSSGELPSGTSPSSGSPTSDDPGTSSSDSSGSADTGNPDATADFEDRCAAPGVIVCRGFDSPDELEPICCEWETGAEADGNGSMDHITIDPEVKTSGDGAMRFEIEGMTGANHSGAFRQLMGQSFGPGTTFYAQFRLRLSESFVATPWDDVVGSSPKIVIFHHSSATCNDIEWTQVMNGWYSHIATMYTHCGQYAPGGTDADAMLQNGDYVCPYGSDYASDPNCFKYAADKWMTFYFKATLGDWGTPTTHLEAFVSVDGQPYQQWIDDPAFTFYAEGESVAGFDSVYLTTYMTAKDDTADHDAAYAWYDELIVSTEPIAVPTAP